MYTRILVPVDGSTFSEQMIALVVPIARKTGAKLALLRVATSAEEQAEATRVVEALAAPAGATAACIVAPAEGVAAAIRDDAQRVAGTLVAMCSQGRSGAMQVVFGSVALDVLRGLGEPVVVFRPQSEGTPAPSTIENVVLALDGSALSETIVPQAGALAKWLGAKVIVVSVIDPDARSVPGVQSNDVQESSYIRGRARMIGDRFGVPVGWEALYGEPKEAIPTYVRGLGNAMLAMTTHGRSGLRAVMTGSVTAQCLREAGVPVFVRLP